MTERIIICINDDGTFKAASAQDFGGLPFPVSLDELQKLGLGSAAEIQELNKQIDNLKIDLDGAATLRKETLEKHGQELIQQLEKHGKEIEALKATHVEELIDARNSYELTLSMCHESIAAQEALFVEMTTEFTAYRNAAEGAARAAQSAIANKSLDDAQTVAKIEEITTAVLMPVEERKKQEALAKIAAIKKEAGLE